MRPAFAKDRARLLREELATAGFDIPHSLALELVAHQNGFRDFNTLAASATDSRRRPWRELEHYDHVGSTMTVGDLRAVMDGQPDDMLVFVTQPNEPEGLSSSGMHAGSADVRPNLLNKRRPGLEIRGDNKTGGYLVPRRLVLELSGLPVGGGPVVAEIVDSVKKAVDEVGFHGERSMGNDIDTGVVTWMHMATDDLPLSAVEDAIRRTVQRHDPGTWTLAPISSAVWLSRINRF